MTPDPYSLNDAPGRRLLFVVFGALLIGWAAVVLSGGALPLVDRLNGIGAGLMGGAAVAMGLTNRWPRGVATVGLGGALLWLVTLLAALVGA